MVTAVGGGRGVEIQHVLDAVQLLLDGRGDGLGQRFGRSTRVGGGDQHGRRRDLRILRDGQHREATSPAMTMMIEMTDAKIGRLMKNLT
jgi:hypothetical protein